MTEPLESVALDKGPGTGRLAAAGREPNATMDNAPLEESGATANLLSAEGKAYASALGGAAEEAVLTKSPTLDSASPPLGMPKRIIFGTGTPLPRHKPPRSDTERAQRPSLLASRHPFARSRGLGFAPNDQKVSKSLIFSADLLSLIGVAGAAHFPRGRPRAHRARRTRTGRSTAVAWARENGAR